MKVVINRCYGGFSLSATAVARLAKLQGKPCYFFKAELNNGKSEYIPVALADIEARRGMFWSASAYPDPDRALDEHADYHDVFLEVRPENRADPLLIQVIEELGCEAASGSYAELKIVEIPDDANYEIGEYDGIETIHEAHRRWS